MAPAARPRVLAPDNPSVILQNQSPPPHGRTQKNPALTLGLLPITMVATLPVMAHTATSIRFLQQVFPWSCLSPWQLPAHSAASPALCADFFCFSASSWVLGSDHFQRFGVSSFLLPRGSWELNS